MNLDQSFSVLFWLNRNKVTDDGEAPIYMRITIDGKRAECSTMRYIKPEYWDSSRGLPVSKYHLAKPLKEYFRQMEAEVYKHYNVLLASREYVTSQDLKNSFRGIKVEVKVQHKSLLEVLAQFTKRLEERMGKNDISVGRWKQFKALRSKCELFIKHHKGTKDILLKDLKLSFIEEFYHYLRTVHSERRKESLRPISQNTAMKYCKQLKQVMDYAWKFEYVLANPFLLFRCTYKRPRRTFLTQDELNLLYEKKMPVARLEEVKDCYLFSCYTGYAYSDAADLNPNHLAIGLDGKKWIMRNRQKTGNPENVPLLLIALEIIEKYKNHPYCVMNGKLLPIISNQKYNGYLKEIAGLVGINKRLTSHTARHTFATTVTLNNGVPIETVSKLLGHDNLRTTQIYAEILDAKVSEDMNVLAEKLANRHPGIQDVSVS